MFDRTEESHETDAEKDLRDPDSDSLTIPRVDSEDVGGGLYEDIQSEFDTESAEPPDVAPDIDPDTSDVPAALLEAFWSIVLVVNGAVLAFALGLMILIFWGDVERGLALVAGGVILSGFAYRRYRNYQRLQEDEEGEDERDVDATRDDTPDNAAADSTTATGDEDHSTSRNRDDEDHSASSDRDDATNDDHP